MLKNVRQRRGLACAQKRLVKRTLSKSSEYGHVPWATLRRLHDASEAGPFEHPAVGQLDELTRVKHPLLNLRVSPAFSFVRGMSRWRSIRLTSEGTRFLLFTLGIGLAAINTGNNLFYLLLAMMLSLIVISGLLSEHCLRRLEFRRHVPDLIMANEPTTLTLSVANRNRHLPSFSLRLLDVVEGQDVDRGLAIHLLPPQSSVLLSYPLLATKRGWIRFEGIRAQTLFPFGLFLKKGLYSTEAHLLVSPPIKPLTLRFVDELVSEGQGESLPRRGHGTQLYNLRLYQPGDDSRAIHWMTTARTSQLIVRETEAEDQRRITVVLSIVAPEEREPLFERSVTFVASLLWQLTERAYPVRLVVGTEDSGHRVGIRSSLGDAAPAGVVRTAAT